MPFSAAVDSFRLAYDRHGRRARAVVLLHGWPGGRHDHGAVVAALADADVVVPDLRGFGESDRHAGSAGRGLRRSRPGGEHLALLDELGLDRAVIGGYDVGSRVARRIAPTIPSAWPGW